MKILNKIIARLNYHKFPLLIFIVLSFVPFLWLNNKNGVFFAYGDIGLHLAFYSPEYILKLSHYLISSNNIGAPSVGFAWYPFALIFSYIFSAVGHNYQYAQMVLYSLIIFVSMVYFYLFILELFEHDDDKKVKALVSGVFYIFNFFTVYYLFGAVIYVLMFMSVILYYLTKALKNKNLFYFLVISLIISLFTINLYSFLPYFDSSWVILFLIFYLFLKDGGLHLKIEINYLLKMLFVILLTNSWWIFPFYNHMFDRYSSAVATTKGFSRIYKSFGGNGNLINILRNALAKNSYWFFHIGYEKTYYNSFFILIGFLIAFVMIIPVIKHPKKFFSFSLLYLIGIYFYLAYAHPFGNLKLWFLTLLPYHYVYIDHYSFMAILIVSASILFGAGSAIIYKFIRKNIGKKISIAVLSFIMIISSAIYVYPGWSNKLFNGYTNLNGKKVTTLVKVPHYYDRAKNFLSSTKINYNIFILPNTGWNTYLNWHFGYDDGGPNFNLLYKHSTFSVQLPGHSLYLFIDFQNHNYPNLSILLGMTSARYVIVQNDMIQGNRNNKIAFFGYSHYLKYIPTPEIKSILNASKGLKLAKSFGKLDIYKLSDKYFLFKVWTPKRVIFVRQRLKLDTLDNYMIPITLQNNFEARTAVFAKLFSRNKHLERIKSYELDNIINKYSVTDKILNISNSSEILKISETAKKITAPTIEFKEINPSKYAVIVHNARAGFPLIFNLRYLKSWDVYPQVYPESASINNSSNSLNDNNRILKRAIANKNITFTGDKFISKDINGTVQNNNIPKGHIFQTLFERPLPDKYHFIANGYANSWWIDLNYIKKLGPRYYKVNKNGTIDFELIINYWPQRLLYIGIIVSVLSIAIFGIYLIYDTIKKRKNKKNTTDTSDNNI